MTILYGNKKTFCDDKRKSCANTFGLPGVPCTTSTTRAGHDTIHDEYHDPIVYNCKFQLIPHVEEIVKKMLDHQCDDPAMAFLLALHRNLSNRDSGVSAVRLIFSINREGRCMLRE